jgi:hypothetical protein
MSETSVETERPTPVEVTVTAPAVPMPVIDGYTQFVLTIIALLLSGIALILLMRFFQNTGLILFPQDFRSEGSKPLLNPNLTFDKTPLIYAVKDELRKKTPGLENFDELRIVRTEWGKKGIYHYRLILGTFEIDPTAELQASFPDRRFWGMECAVVLRHDPFRDTWKVVAFNTDPIDDADPDTTEIMKLWSTMER